MKPQANIGIDWDAEPLGVVSDRELAKRKGCHFTTVRKAREARGIPPFRSQADREDDKKKIRALAERFSNQDIADIMGFHNSYISRVLSGVVA